MWLNRFDLFLFDFDGLLVDTEPVHFRAFQEMLLRNGCVSHLTLAQYIKLAHANATDLRDHTYHTFGALFQEKPDWEQLRAEKAKIYIELLGREALELLPGVASLLQSLQDLGKRRAVVTNSSVEQVDRIRAKIPLLDTIPLWLCREHYQFPKPHPAGYLLAIQKLGKEGDRVIGFEDSLKGLKALQATPAQPVLITPREDIPKNIVHFKSFEEDFDKEEALWGSR